MTRGLRIPHRSPAQARRFRSTRQQETDLQRAHVEYERRLRSAYSAAVRYHELAREVARLGHLDTRRGQRLINRSRVHLEDAQALLDELHGALPKVAI